MYIAIDFDGTVVKHEYPNIGDDVPLACEVIKDIERSGHDIILLTMRSGKELDDAINWYSQKGIKLFAVNSNPTQYEWTNSTKVYANLYIDDAALGCPLVQDFIVSDDSVERFGRPYVNWSEVDSYLKSNGII